MSKKSKKAPLHNAPWEVCEVDLLRACAKAKKSAREAAKELGRSTGATKFKAMVLGVRFHAINQPKGSQVKALKTIRARQRKLSAAAKKGAATRKAKRGPMVSNHAL